MKIICQLLTKKINPKTALIVIIAFFSGHISPEIIQVMLDLLAE